mgnify:CR=1 FL=1
MSKDMLGPTIRALVGVPQEYLGTVADIANRLSSEQGKVWHARFAEAAKQKLEPVKPPKLLILRGSVEVALTKPHNPDEFFQTRTGLYVYDNFGTRVVAKARLTTAASRARLKRFELGQNMTDEQIEMELGPNHNFSDDEVCWVIAEMIGKQPDGEAGELLNNGYANLFYTSSCVVDVRWNADDRYWRVRTWYRGDDTWFAGARAFSRN